MFYLNPKFQVSMTIQADLCVSWMETPKTGFLTSQFMYTCTSKLKFFWTSSKVVVSSHVSNMSGIVSVIKKN